MPNIEILPVTEFSPGKTEFACGPFAVAICAWASQPGKPATNQPGALSAWAYAEYAKVNGNDLPDNTNGSSIGNMRQFFKDTQAGTVPNALHYWEMDTVNVASIEAALMHGYPVIVTVTEASVYDTELGKNPYWWGATGSHIFVIVGIDNQGNFEVFDSANVDKGDGNLQTPKTPLAWPCYYSENKMAFTGYATPVQMPWLPEIPSGNPLNWQPPASPIIPVNAIEQEALYVWHSIDIGIPTNTGIANAWLLDYKKGINHGPPLEQEIVYIDRSGKSGKLQTFAGGQFVWLDGTATWVKYQ